MVKNYQVIADEKEIKNQIESKTSSDEKMKVFEVKKGSIYCEDYKSSLGEFIEFVSKEGA